MPHTRREQLMAELRWDDIPLFLAAYRTRSLTQAALQTGLNQSTTSRRLAALEQSLGARLFERTPQGLVPTEAAERMLAAAERAETATHDALRAVDGLQRAASGTVRLALTDGMSVHGIAPMVAEFRARQPHVVLSLVVSNEIANLSRREADLAIRFVRPDGGDLVTRRVYEGPYGLFATEAMAARAASDGLVLVGWDESYEQLSEARWEAASGIPIVARATTVSSRIAMAVTGAGAIVLPCAFAALLDGLVKLPVDVPLRAEAWLVAHEASRDIPRIRVTWDFLVEAFVRLVDDRPR